MHETFELWWGIEAVVGGWSTHIAVLQRMLLKYQSKARPLCIFTHYSGHL